MNKMAYTLSNHEEIMVLSLDDLWNPEENNKLLAEIDAEIADGHVFYVVDMQAVPFMNSNGLAFLISILTRSRSAGGEVVLANISEKIDQILIMTRLKSTFNTTQSVAEALELLQTSPSL